MNDDRAARESISAFLSEFGGSPSVRPVPDDADRPARIRNLRATFRATPGGGIGSVLADADPGFPGTRAFAPHRPDRGATGPTIQSTPERNDGAPAPAAGADDAARRNATIQAAIDRATGQRTALPADARPDGGDVRGRGRGRSATNSGAVGGAGRRGRPPGSGKKKEKPIKAVKPIPLPAAIKKLVPKTDEPKISPKLIPTEVERADARRLFREIGQRFNDNRKKSKTAAYAGFRHDLMDNLDTLVMGGAIDLKEATTIITNLEQYTRETEAESVETPATILGRWLRMDAAEAAGLEVAASEPMDANDQSIDEEEVEEELEEVEAIDILG